MEKNRKQASVIRVLGRSLSVCDLQAQGWLNSPSPTLHIEVMITPVTVIVNMQEWRTKTPPGRTQFCTSLSCYIIYSTKATGHSKIVCNTSVCHYLIINPLMGQASDVFEQTIGVFLHIQNRLHLRRCDLEISQVCLAIILCIISINFKLT